MNRSPNGINVHRFLESFGVKVLPYHMKRDPRPANIVYGGREVARLMRKDMELTGLVIRCIQVSNPTCFDDLTIWSVWRFITAHSSQAKPTDTIAAFSGIDLALIRERAQRLAIGEGGRLAKSPVAISILLAQELIQERKTA